MSRVVMDDLKTLEEVFTQVPAFAVKTGGHAVVTTPVINGSRTELRCFGSNQGHWGRKNRGISICLSASHHANSMSNNDRRFRTYLPPGWTEENIRSRIVLVFKNLINDDLKEKQYQEEIARKKQAAKELLVTTAKKAVPIAQESNRRKLKSLVCDYCISTCLSYSTH